jgi:hypothetical protein
MQLSGLFDTCTFTVFLQTLRKAVFSTGQPGAAPEQPHGSKSQRTQGATRKGASRQRDVSSCDEDSGNDSGPEDNRKRSKIAAKAVGQDGLSVCVQALVDLSAFLQVNSSEGILNSLKFEPAFQPASSVLCNPTSLKGLWAQESARGGNLAH